MKRHFMDDFWMGPGTHQIKVEMYEENRKRVIKRLKDKKIQRSVIFLKGNSEIPQYDSDLNYAFRQEPFFQWTFGIQEPDCYGLIEVDTGKTIGFFPRPVLVDMQWLGPPECLSKLKDKYKFQEAYYTDEISNILTSMNSPTLLILKGINSDSDLPFNEAHFKGMNIFCVNKDILYDEMAELRSIKTDLEIEVMRYVTTISSDAHKQVMLFSKPGKYQYQCESEFIYYCYNFGGSKHCGYNCICPSGKYSAILHYGHALKPNDCIIKDGEMCLFDMGCSYFGYTADITCTFPANGKFTEDQKLIYEAVLEANLAVAKNVKPGVAWDHMHLLANMTMLKKLKEGGLLQNDLEEMMEADVAYYFQPHGLGHLLGMDVHDVGGYLKKHPQRRQIRSLKSLRTARKLEKGMILTIEPGCYFIDFLLDEAFEDSNINKFLVVDVIERFRGFGGIRIEDDILVTECGMELLNKVPRTVLEIEEWMSQKNHAC